MPKGKKHQRQAYRIPDAQELYNLWMSQIEPELMTMNIEHADERNAGETAEERKERYAWYSQAFQMFDKHRSTVDLALQKECSRFIREMDKAAERQQSAKDSATLRNIDEAIQTAL